MRTRINQHSTEVAALVAACCSQFGVSREEVFGRSRLMAIVNARHCAFYLLRQRGHGYSAIARLFGVHKGTVHAAYVKMLSYIKYHDPIIHDLETIKHSIHEAEAK